MKNSEPIFEANPRLVADIADGFRLERSPVDLETATALATDILKDTMQFRRTHGADDSCNSTSCLACFAPHLHKLVSAIMQRKPITFVLPAFPGKSPNLAKVFGPLPDMGERLALEFLSRFCDRVKQLYAPGARIILCSDGRVFSDVVGMREEEVTAYQCELARTIEDLEITNISIFNLDELCKGKSFDQARRELMTQFGQPLESLKETVRRGGARSESRVDREAHRLYCGITRFLFEDAQYPGQAKSRTSIQKDCRARAYDVILRSNAWSELIAERFPDAIRLSIHPQTCGAKKLGILLLGGDGWMTPWHGVAVEIGKEFVLMKRWEAEKLAARLVRDSQGRPSHYELESMPKLKYDI